MEAFYDKTNDNSYDVVADSVTVNGPLISTVNWGKYSLTADSSTLTSTNTKIGNIQTDATSGVYLTLSGGDTFTNNLGRTIYATVSCTCRRTAGATNQTIVWIQTSSANTIWSKSSVTGTAVLTVSSTITLAVGETMSIYNFQDSGSTQSIYQFSFLLSILVHH